MTKKKPTLSDIVHPRINGTGYFLGLTSPMDLNPQDYVAFRVTESPNPLTASMLHQEWQKWISTLKKSGLEAYEIAAKQVSTPSKSIINGWLDKPNKKRKAIVESSSRVLRSSSSSNKAKHLDVEDIYNMPSNQSISSTSKPAPPMGSSLGSSPNTIHKQHPITEVAIPSNQPEEATSSSSSSQSSHFYSSASRSSASRSSSKNSKISLSPYAISWMKNEFIENFNGFKGQAWILPSRTNFDNVIYQYVLSLMAESTIHSFVIVSMDAVLSLFSYQDKQDILEKIAKLDNTLQNAATLPIWKRDEINRFKVPPSKVLLILEGGWVRKEMDGAIKSKDFRRSLYQLVHSIYTVYEAYNFKLPEGQLEAWYRTKIWGFLANFFDFGGKLELQPEFTSRASTTRRNIDRNFPDKQQQGKRVDASIICNTTRLELCAIEAGKVDIGPTGTKIMTDGRKLGKIMKDMFDAVCSKCPDDIKHELVIFGMLFSGSRITFLSFQFLGGRFFRINIESSVFFPPTWDNEGIMSTTIISLITKLYCFKERLEEMSKNVAQWSQIHEDSEGLDKKPLIRTLTTPPSSPRPEKSP
ncbi:hypothetical protein BGZ76_003519 [Entomortierella beljakovae]|nr:hypothetical protein BGZ76_003519 [Entomortierella beljakovae]